MVARRALLLCLLCCTAISLHIKRDEMESDEVEYPATSVSDQLAGAPGVDIIVTPSFGTAHATASEQPEAPCDMTGTSGSRSPGEDLKSWAPRDPVKPTPIERVGVGYRDPSRSPSSSPRPSPSAVDLEKTETTPSPTPSHLPSREERVLLRAVNRFAHIKERSCVRTSATLVPLVLEDMESVDISQPPKIFCSGVELPESGSFEPTIEDLRQPNDSIENALAGYDEGSPLAADRTRHAALNMNNNINLDMLELSEGLQSASIEEDAWQVVVRLFQDNVSPPIQCAPGTPDIETLLRSVDRLPACNRTLVSLSRSIDSTQELYDSIILKLKSNFNTSAPAIRTNDNSEDYSPDAYDPTSMQTESQSDCDDTTETSRVANENVVQDLRGKAPGSRAPFKDSTNADEAASLPEFGRQQIEWGRRDSHVVVLTHPGNQSS